MTGFRFDFVELSDGREALNKPYTVGMELQAYYMPRIYSEAKKEGVAA